MTTNEMRALDPMQFRFTDPEDVQKYGDGWYTYDEGHYLRMRARDLIAIEGAMNLSITGVMNGMRADTTLGDTAAAWLGVREKDPKLAGEFDAFNPVTNRIEWRDAAEGKAEAAAMEKYPGPEPLDTPPTQDKGLPMAGPSPDTISAPMDTVILPGLPDVA